jgi:hypothetical protein
MGLTEGVKHSEHHPMNINDGVLEWRKSHAHCGTRCQDVASADQIIPQWNSGHGIKYLHHTAFQSKQFSP